jgi:magnesium transporter
MILPFPVELRTSDFGLRHAPATLPRMTDNSQHLQAPITAYVRKDFPRLRDNMTVQQALDFIRQQGVGEQIVYFYVLDDRDQLIGVLPTRRILTAPLQRRLAEIMVRQIVAIPSTASVLDACEMFVMHKFLAFPVIDGQRRILGIVDVNLFRDEIFGIAEHEKMDEVFEVLGFHISHVRDASPVRAFRFRFPWLLTNIASGTICALLAGAYETTLARSLVLAFFLTLVLGLGESVSIQSMSVTIQALRAIRPTLGWFLKSLRREAGTALMLGSACGLIVALIAWLWKGAPLAAAVIGGSIFLTLCAACFFGLVIPSLLHWLRLDPKIAAGPITLALTDIATLLFYFNLGSLLL